MDDMQLPAAEFLLRQSALICSSYAHWTGRQLLQGEMGDIVHRLFEADFAVLSHDTRPEPVFNYANRAAMRLFGMNWDEITRLPSRHSAEPMLQEERAGFLERVAAYGYVDDYSGVRIARDGSKFMIVNATVWNLVDGDGMYYGQAALIPQWRRL
jgi:hypothetical protein